MRRRRPPQRLDDFFPYFCLVFGGITLAIGAWAPPGDGKTAAITAGSNLVTMGGTAYGTKLRFMGRED